MSLQIERLSVEIARIYYANRGNANISVDPALVLIISQIILEIFKLINSCQQTHSSVKGMCSSPRLFQRVVLRRAVKEHLDVDNKPLTKQISSAIMNRASSLSVNEIEILMSSV